MNEKIITNLSNKELSVIKAVDTLGNASVLQIAKKSGLKRTTIYNFIDKLVDNDLLGVEIINGARRYFEPNENLSMLEVKNTGNAQKVENLSVLLTVNLVFKEINKLLKADDFCCLVGASLAFNKKILPSWHKFFEKISQSNLNARVLISDQIKERLMLNTDKLNCRICGDFSADSSLFITAKQVIIYSSDKKGTGYKILDPLFCESLQSVFNNYWQQAK